MNSKGQVTIEFIFSFIMIFTFIVLFSYLALNYVAGYYAHYATYSAARVYMTQDQRQETPNQYGFAQTQARGTFQSFELKKFGLDFNDIKFNNPHTTDIYEFVGAYLLFDPPTKLGLGEEGKKELVSESFLGKEPTRSDCECQIKKAMGFNCNTPQVPGDVTLYDNGC